ncbi:MAG: hypothetical protein ACI9M6_000565, partial [Hydrogenophaga sp.]
RRRQMNGTQSGWICHQSSGRRDSNDINTSCRNPEASHVVNRVGRWQWEQQWA